ncbi:glycosyltransferase [Thermodesulfitimonas sp.]
MGQIKVLHLIGGGEFGGAERHILTLFKASDPREVLLDAACLFAVPFAPLAREEGMKVTVLPMRSKLDLTIVRKLRSILLGYDILHTHGVRANFLGRLAARGAGLPVVSTVHSLLSLDYPHPVSRLLNALCERSTRGLTDHFIAVSAYLAAAIEREGVPREKVSVVYNGIAPVNGDVRVPAPLRARFSIPGDVPLVAAVGRLHRVKGHHYFIAAAAEVLKRYPQARFLVIGAGPERNNLEDLVAKLGLAGKVLFTGFLKDIREHYSEFSLLVLSSLSEGLPLTVLEAFLSGTPVVATRVGGLPEVIQEGETGILVPPADVGALAAGICRVLDDPATARAMAARGRELVKRKFSARRMAEGTLAVYRRVLES